MKAYVKNHVRIDRVREISVCSRHRVNYGEVTGYRYVAWDCWRDVRIMRRYDAPAVYARLQRNYKR